MTTQRTTEGHSGSHSYTREGAEPFAIKSLRETFEAYPPAEQARIRERVIAELRAESQRAEFRARIANDQSKRPGSALTRYAWPVYGIRIEDL